MKKEEIEYLKEVATDILMDSLAEKLKEQVEAVEKRQQESNKEDHQDLTKEDMYCIARLLQGAIFTDSPFYGCGYCKYNEECVQTRKVDHFKIIREKLQGITGLDMGYMYSQKNPEAKIRERETLKQAVKRYNEDKKTFICSEAFEIFYKTKDEKIALEALRLIKEVVQSF